MIFSWHLDMYKCCAFAHDYKPQNKHHIRKNYIHLFLSPTIYYKKQVIKGLFCFPGVFHYTEVVEDAEGSAFFDQVSNISTGIFVRGSPYILQV